MVVVHGLAPKNREVGDVAIAAGERCQAECAAHGGASIHGDLGEGRREAVGHDASAVHSQELNVAQAVPEAVPGQDEAVALIRRAEVGGDHLGILIEVAVAGDQHGAAQGSVGAYHGVAHLIGGGVAGAALVQGVDRHGGAVGEHGGFQRLHAAIGAVVERCGRAPSAAFIVAIVDGVLGLEVQGVVGVGVIDAAPEDHGAVLSIGGHHGGEIRRAVGGEAGGRPIRAVVDRGHDFRAVHQEVLLLHTDFVIGVLAGQVGGKTHEGCRREGRIARDVHIAVAEAFEVRRIVDGAGDSVAAAGEDAIVGAALVDTAVIAVADVGEDLAVVAELRVGIGVGVGLQAL